MMELLAPAGGIDALVAAVQSGADAVYMGFGAFNARRSAKNFTDAEFASAVDYCHLRGVRVFLTLNTLLTDRELPEAAETLQKANDMGVDAVLVQDWGLLAAARELAPDLPLHASTQMSLFTLGGAREAERLGMERVVLARELSRDEVAEICAGCGAEVEIFGHGALCMCYSGQCEMSAVLGQRSGNRGACAQPCRLPYGVNAPCGADYPLSLKDANLADYLQDMERIGVTCLKLEGRMKRPEYVAVVTSIYRRLLDEKRLPTPSERTALELAFSRSGFTDGYWRGKKGRSMFGTRPENTPEPKALFAKAREVYENGKEHRKIPVNLRLTVRRGTPLTLTGVCGGAVATAQGDVPETARNRAVTAEELRQRLSKTGGTVFSADHMEVELDEGLMVSAGAVNALRREVLDELAARRTAAPERRISALKPLPDAPEGAAEPDFTVSIVRPDQLTPELLAEKPAIVYLPAELLDAIDLSPYAGQTELCAVLPRVFRTADEAVLRDILARHGEVNSVAVGNLGHLPIVRGLGKTLRGDFGLNIYNSRALHFWQTQGLSSATVSFELRWQQVRDLRKYLPCEAVIYGRLPLMVTENCMTKNAVGCAHGAGSILTDRTGAQFPVLCGYGCRCEIENGKTLVLADKPEVFRCGLRYGRLRFTTETAEECAAILRAHRSGSVTPGADVTRGLFYRGVE